MAVSVVLHFLLLWPAALPQAFRQAAPAPLSATLRAPAAGQAPARAGAGLPAIARADIAGKPAPAPERAAVFAGKSQHAQQQRPSLPAGEEEQPAMPSGAREGAGGPQPSLPPQAPDADGIRAYRIGLAREARGHRRYPALARERGWTGTAEIEVDVSRQGQPRQVLLARSSGHEVLDREAVLMMSRAAEIAALPDSLRGREFAVRVPVVFELGEQ